MRVCNASTVIVFCAFSGLAFGQAVQLGPSASTGLGENPYGGVRDLLWDNGDTNGVNGISQLGDPYRSTLEDFTITDDGGWDLTDFHTLTLWSSGQSFLGTGYEITFRADSGSTPGAVITVANVTDYVESSTGRVWFGRPEMLMDVTFDVVHLDPGTYWVEMRVLGPENAFQMVQNDNPMLEAVWVDYSDLGGLQPGFNIFGADYHVSFTLGGTIGGPCVADCDGNGTVNTLDFLCFLNLFSNGDPGADCDGNGIINTLDFLCFLNAFNTGCE